jgi:hypothetical protein
MTDNRCPIWIGVGWVCENHPDMPWNADFGCMCGVGAPCECNDSDPPDTSEVIVIKERHGSLTIRIYGKVTTLATPRNGPQPKVLSLYHRNFWAVIGD